MLKRNVQVLSLLLVLSAAAFAKEWWEKKPYLEWSDKEAARMLDNSPWGKIHVITVNNEQYSGDTKTFQSIGGGDLEREKRNRFHIHFLTAKPVKMAIARKLFLDKRVAEMGQLQEFVEQPNDQAIVVAVTLSSDPPGASSLSGYNSALMKLSTPSLSSNTNLATSSGNRVYLIRYDPPGPDGLGAKFYFPRRMPDGKPLLKPEDKEIRFQTEITLVENTNVTFQTGYEKQRTDQVWMQFDLRKMIFEGKLEI